MKKMLVQVFLFSALFSCPLWRAAVGLEIPPPYPGQPPGFPRRAMRPAMPYAAPANPAPARNQLPPDALEIMTHYDREEGELLKQAHRQIRNVRRQLAAALRPLQERYTRDAKLEDAVNIRDAIKALSELQLQARPEPNFLVEFNSKIGSVFLFRVTGHNAGTIWGTDIYTTDSRLGVAAVHAGVLESGETGTLKVTILPGQDAYEGSTRNGVTSSSWPGYPASYKVERAAEQDEEYQPEQPDPSIFSGDPAKGLQVKLPGEAQELVARFETQAAEARDDVRRKICKLRATTRADLKILQERYTREGKLDEALTVREQIGALNEYLVKVLPDPASLHSFGTEGVHYFKVTGQSGGGVWGTDIYTFDSRLATAAVHAGVLREGESRILKVTLLPGRENYEGTTRNGITTSSYGPYSGSYQVVAAVDNEVYCGEAEAAPKNKLEALRRELERARDHVARTERELDSAREELRRLQDNLEKFEKNPEQ